MNCHIKITKLKSQVVATYGTGALCCLSMYATIIIEDLRRCRDSGAPLRYRANSVPYIYPNPLSPRILNHSYSLPHKMLHLSALTQVNDANDFPHALHNFWSTCESGGAAKRSFQSDVICSAFPSRTQAHPWFALESAGGLILLSLLIPDK